MTKGEKVSKIDTKDTFYKIRMKRSQKVDNKAAGMNMSVAFYRIGNFVSYTIKTLRGDAHSRAEKMSAELTTLCAQKQSSPS